MNNIALASAVRGYTQDPFDPNDLSDIKELLRVLAHIVEGMPIERAFGSPGDWGYSQPIGKAIAAKPASASADPCSLISDPCSPEVASDR